MHREGRKDLMIVGRFQYHAQRRKKGSAQRRKDLMIVGRLQYHAHVQRSKEGSDDSW